MTKKYMNLHRSVKCIDTAEKLMNSKKSILKVSSHLENKRRCNKNGRLCLWHTQDLESAAGFRVS